MSDDRMELERFTRFLVREGARYHAPPEPPRREMWEAIEGALRAESGDEERPPVSVDALDDAGLAAAAAGYHAPPVPPHEDMWGRIEASWSLRRSAPEGSREAGLDELPAAIADETSEGRGWRRVGMAIAVAASLVIGIAIGRTSSGPVAGPAVAVEDAGEVTPPAGTTPAAERVPDGMADASAPPDAFGDAPPVTVERLETAPRDARVAAAEDLPPTEAAAAGPGSPGVGLGSERETDPRRSVAVRLATSKHLGRAETLLTAFRTDPESVGDAEAGRVSAWARDLLGETRLLLDLSTERPRDEIALLEELELVLAQIAGLGPEAPAFERDLVAEGLARLGTIARLRAASPPGMRASLGT